VPLWENSLPNNPHRRRSIRLKDYDYTESGAYFVTICSLNSKCMFGKVLNGEMELSEAGRIVESEWLKVKVVRFNVRLDQFIVMPNHFHAILWIEGNHKGTASCAPTIHQFGKILSGSLSAIIRGFKATVTNHLNIIYNTEGEIIWQRNYHEHVIRNKQSLNKIREYIKNNPLSWELDRENPERKGENEFYRWLATFKNVPKKPKM
jgi:putative transposase